MTLEGLGVPIYGAFERGKADQTVVWSGYDTGRLQIGQTNDILYGGDISGDVAGDGITVVSADGDAHFALDVYADDGGTELAAGWVSAIFGNVKNTIAVTPAANLSMFGVTGQMHAGASIASIGNIAGLYGLAETVSGVTLDCNFFGAHLGASIPSGATLGAGYYAGGLLIGGNYTGTTTGKTVGIYYINSGLDYAFAFGQNAEYASVVATGAVGGSQTHKIKVLIGGTEMFIPLNTA